MASQAWNLAFSSMSAVGVMLVKTPTHTQFSEAHVVNTLSAEFLGECAPSQGSSNNVLNSIAPKIIFDLHQLGDVISDAYLEIDIPPLPVMPGDVGVLHGVNAMGLAMIDNWQTMIGKQSYEVQHSELMYFLEELCNTPGDRPTEEIGDWRDPAILQHLSQFPQHFSVKLRTWWTQQQKTGSLADALKLCTAGGNAVEVQVTFDNYANWLVYTPNDNWSNQTLVKFVQSTLASSSVRLFGRYHWMEKKEREYYQDNGIMSFYSFWQYAFHDMPTTSLSTLKLTFNFPCNAVLWAVRNDTYALTDGQLYPGKIGTKDKFFFGSSTGVEPITKIDLAINSQSLITYAAYSTSMMRNIMQKRGWGHRTTMPLYALVCQSEIDQRHIRGFIDFSRFDNVTTAVTISEPGGKLFMWAHAKNVMTADYGTWTRPFAS